MPTIICPNCNQTYEVDENVIGGKVKCAVCNITFVTQAPNDLQKANDIASQEQRNYNPTNCPFCNYTLVPGAPFCPNCGNRVNAINDNAMNSYSGNALQKENNTLKNFINGQNNGFKVVVLSIVCVIMMALVVVFYVFKKADTFPSEYAIAHKQYGITKGDVELLENQPSISALHATMPSYSVKLMVRAWLSDYYNYGYSNSKNTHYSIECSGLTTGVNGLGRVVYESFGYGYVLRDTTDGKLLFEKLKDGKAHIAIISIRYDYRSSSKGNMFEICEVHEVR